LRRRVTTLVTVSLLASLASCGDDDQPSQDDTGDDQSRAGGTATLTSPLTGRPVEGVLPEHPVIAVKIDNTSSAQPQLGLSGADLVTEELVEGGSTRLNVFFYSAAPDIIGPLRSMRTSDIGIVGPAEAVLVASGGSRKPVAAMKDADITTITEAADGAESGYQRAGDRPVPYNLMMRLPDLVRHLDDADPPPQYLPFGDNDMDGGRPAEAFDVAFSGLHTTSFEYEEGSGYSRRGSIAQRGDDFVADSVLVLRVKQGDAGYFDPAGNPVPETIYEGEGEAMLFHGGAMIKGTWSKDELSSPLELTTESGDPLAVPPGNTWIELAPVDSDGGSVRIG
jgi:hypothetical protein